MTLVKPLGRYFTRMVDPHETGRVPALIRRQLRIRYPIGRTGSA
jgi:hypothetical protein